jgi:predicted acetyltransferase
VWLAREGRENIRVARVDGSIAGGLILQRMGQWFGGRSVPMSAVRCVGVGPEHRASGVASHLMRAALVEMKDAGVAISTLFPATQPVYRRAGYERAGLRLRYRLPAAAIDVHDRETAIRVKRDDDVEFIRDIYTHRARYTNGNLDRNEWYWQRIHDPLPHGQAHYMYVVDGESGPEGYISYAHRPTPTPHRHEIDVIDWSASTPRAQRRLLSFLADHRSMVEWINLCGPPADPALIQLGEQRAAVTERIDWMLRIVDVRTALEARGYPPGLTQELHMEVTDDVIEHNNGCFVLSVADGTGRVSRGGRGDIRTNVRGLAAMYTGHLTPAALQLAGLLNGEDTVLSAAAHTFAAPAPWMLDMF